MATAGQLEKVEWQLGGSWKKAGLQLDGVFGQLWGGNLTVEWKMGGSSVAVAQTLDRICGDILATYINNSIDTMSSEARGGEARRGEMLFWGIRFKRPNAVGFRLEG